MKKILILFLMIAVKGSFAQLISNVCPCGSQVIIDIDKFNLRKPRTECSRGFGICIRIDKIIINCTPCEGGKSLKASQEGNLITGYLKGGCGNLTLHLPASLAKDEIFGGEPLKEFEIEDDAIPLSDGQSPVLYRVRGGIYPVELVDEELVVRLNYY